MLMSMSLLINVQSKSSENLIFMSDTILIFDFNEIKSLALTLRLAREYKRIIDKRIVRRDSMFLA